MKKVSTKTWRTAVHIPTTLQLDDDVREKKLTLSMHSIKETVQKNNKKVQNTHEIKCDKMLKCLEYSITCNNLIIFNEKGEFRTNN